MAENRYAGMLFKEDWTCSLIPTEEGGGQRMEVKEFGAFQSVSLHTSKNRENAFIAVGLNVFITFIKNMPPLPPIY